MAPGAAAAASTSIIDSTYQYNTIRIPRILAPVLDSWSRERGTWIRASQAPAATGLGRIVSSRG
jgi:hypothetical protein